MNAYVDTSALLRLLLREDGALTNLRTFDRLVSSELITVESRRTIDRMRLRGAITAAEAAVRLKIVSNWLDAIDLVRLQPSVLTRASEPMPAPLGTLDALHLATALVWRDRKGPLDVVATHDGTLAAAAAMFGFDVVGVSPLTM